MTRRAWALLGLGVAGGVGLAAALVVVLTSNHESEKWLAVSAGAVVGLNFMGTGLFAWWRRPSNHTGLLMYAVGATFVLAAGKDANAPVLFELGLIFSNLFIAVLVHLLVAFPAGRLVGREERLRSSPARKASGTATSVTELRARISELEESRSRVLAAELQERRRIERDLHDGAQQRFVSLSLTLALLDRGLSDPAARELLTSGREQLDLGLTELRELARGIHPAVLTERGLAPAIDALAARAPLDVRVLEVPEERLPAQVETAAYFIVAESLTNAAKHAHADAATVRIARDNGAAVIEVSDDGVGGRGSDARLRAARATC